MWWWVLISPGVTRQPAAPSVSFAAGGASVEPPTALTRPSVIATQPPAISRRSSSTVATRSAPLTRRSHVASGIDVVYRALTHGFNVLLKTVGVEDSKLVVHPVDLAPFRDGTPADRAGVAAAIDAACRDTGFLVLTGHGLQDDVVRRWFDAFTECSALPMEEKLGYVVEKAAAN